MQKPLTQLSQPPCLLPLGEMVCAHPGSCSEFYWNQVSEASLPVPAGACLALGFLHCLFEGPPLCPALQGFQAFQRQNLLYSLSLLSWEGG